MIMEKLIIAKLEEENTRKIITVIFQYYNVPKPLREAYWRAFNAAHGEGMNVA